MKASLEIGGNVPAIPDEEGIGYWGYNSFSEASILWWDSLPNSPDEPAGISHLKEKVAEDTTLEHIILWKITPDVWAIEGRPGDYPSTWSFYGEDEAKKRWGILVNRARRCMASVEEFNNRNKY
jgi:hypothetical protein